MMRATDPFRELYDANYRHVREIVARMAGREEADDLAQIVFTKAAKALPDFRGEARASTWLYRIAANVASDWLRSPVGREANAAAPLTDKSDDQAGGPAAPADFATYDGSSPEHALTRRQVTQSIRTEIAGLADPYREILFLAMFGGLSEGELSDALGITRTNAKVRLHRAKLALKQVIGPRCEFYRTELSCKPSSPTCCQPAPSDAEDTGTRPPML
ncbi:MAG: sigma-70 family RNA polymerase sigma factor [Xanthobacteraceae bacterium]|nr:sigma-70 family RNA polymerase sigma factor [Xanthobacteraceae bacterium]